MQYAMGKVHNVLPFIVTDALLYVYANIFVSLNTCKNWKSDMKSQTLFLANIFEVLKLG